MTQRSSNDNMPSYFPSVVAVEAGLPRQSGVLAPVTASSRRPPDGQKPTLSPSRSTRVVPATHGASDGFARTKKMVDGIERQSAIGHRRREVARFVGTAY